jgi:hypothetical protein
MITNSYVQALPSGISMDEFEAWYLGAHAEIARTCPGLAYYCVNRAYAQQPSLAHEPASPLGPHIRIAQLSWPDVDSAQRSLQSFNGAATRGDAVGNVVHPSMAITADRQFAVRQPAGYDVYEAKFRASSDGSITKLLCFGETPGKSIGDDYDRHFTDLGNADAVRAHVFGETVGRHIRIPISGTIPESGQRSWDWRLELCFDSPEEAIDFTKSKDFEQAWEFLAEASTDTMVSLLKGQVLLISTPAVAHHDS